MSQQLIYQTPKEADETDRPETKYKEFLVPEDGGRRIYVDGLNGEETVPLFVINTYDKGAEPVPIFVNEKRLVLEAHNNSMHLDTGEYAIGIPKKTKNPITVFTQ